jgi:hypothetical protein
MRLLGFVLLILGIIFALLFVLAWLGGGKNLHSGFVITAILITMGWRLYTSGTGFAQRQASAAPAAHAHLEPVPAPQSPTVELPCPAAVSALIARRMARAQRVIALVIAGGMAFFFVLGVGMDLTVPSPSGLKALPFLAPISVAFGLIVGGSWLVTGARPLRRDLHEPTYLRTSGPVQLVPLPGGAVLRLADRAFLVDARLAATMPQNLTWATVDYSRHAHIIFEVRDRSGQRVYALDESAVG